LIENIQREDLNPVEEAMAYRELMEVYGMTQESVAETVGKSRSAVANSLRLLALPDYVIDMLKTGEITAGHAKAIAGIKDTEMIKAIIEKVKNDGMTVRRLEAMVAELNAEINSEQETDQEAGGKVKKEKSEQHRRLMKYLTEMEISLENTLSRKIKINSNDGEKGTITIDFYDRDDLATIAEKLTV